jgi:hypothetical protein
MCKMLSSAELPVILQMAEAILSFLQRHGGAEPEFEPFEGLLCELD